MGRRGGGKYGRVHCRYGSGTARIRSVHLSQVPREGGSKKIEFILRAKYFYIKLQEMERGYLLYDILVTRGTEVESGKQAAKRPTNEAKYQKCSSSFKDNCHL